jgi:hypothetical protein
MITSVHRLYRWKAQICGRLENRGSRHLTKLESPIWGPLSPGPHIRASCACWVDPDSAYSPLHRRNIEISTNVARMLSIKDKPNLTKCYKILHRTKIKYIWLCGAAYTPWISPRDETRWQLDSTKRSLLLESWYRTM